MTETCDIRKGEIKKERKKILYYTVYRRTQEMLKNRRKSASAKKQNKSAAPAKGWPLWYFQYPSLPALGWATLRWWLYCPRKTTISRNENTPKKKILHTTGNRKESNQGRDSFHVQDRTKRQDAQDKISGVGCSQNVSERGVGCVPEPSTSEGCRNRCETTVTASPWMTGGEKTTV